MDLYASTKRFDLFVIKAHCQTKFFGFMVLILLISISVEVCALVLHYEKQLSMRQNRGKELKGLQLREQGKKYLHVQ